MKKVKIIGATFCLLFVSSNWGQFVVTDPGQITQQSMMVQQLIQMNAKFVEQSITDKAQFADDIAEQTSQTTHLASTVSHLKDLKEAYDKYNLETLKDLYDLVKLYACVLKEYEILASVSGTVNEDCILSFQFKKALAKFNASKEMIGALGLINTGIKLSQSEQMETLSEAIELLEESFNDIAKLNQTLRFNLNTELENLMIKQSLLDASSKGQKVNWELYEQD